MSKHQQPSSRLRRVLGLGLLALAAGSSLAQAPNPAADYPNKPITFIVPYPAGGSSDARSRMLAKKLEEYLGQAVVVDNRSGAGGIIGTQAIARAKPDGYTIGLGNFGPLAVNKSLYKNLPYDPAKDLDPIALLEKGPLVLVVAASSPYRSLADLVADMKAKPGALSYASTGSGSSGSMSTELFKDAAKVSAVHVPYRGGAPAVNDVISGTTTFMMELASLYLPHASGPTPRLRILAVASESRLPALPEVPTFAELGYPSMVVANWFGVVAPKGVAPEILAKLNQAINRATQDPAYRKIVIDQGAQVGGGTPAMFQTFVEAESKRWGTLIQQKGIKVE